MTAIRVLMPLKIQLANDRFTYTAAFQTLKLERQLMALNSQTEIVNPTNASFFEANFKT